MPQIMGQNSGLKSKTHRIWFSRTGKQYSNLCLRFMIDPDQVHATNNIVFSEICIGPPRPEPDIVEPAEEVAVDECFEDGETPPGVEAMEGVQGDNAGGPGVDAGGADDNDDGLFV